MGWYQDLVTLGMCTDAQNKFSQIHLNPFVYAYTELDNVDWLRWLLMRISLPRETYLRLTDALIDTRIKNVPETLAHYAVLCQCRRGAADMDIAANVDTLVRHADLSTDNGLLDPYQYWTTIRVNKALAQLVVQYAEMRKSISPHEPRFYLDCILSRVMASMFVDLPSPQDVGITAGRISVTAFDSAMASLVQRQHHIAVCNLIRDHLLVGELEKAIADAASKKRKLAKPKKSKT